MGGLSAMSASVLGADSLLHQRSLELPSIVPTADGMVGFCTITAQQFQDFLIMIDRADLVDDAELASFAGRVERRDEFLGMVTQWTQTRTTQEIVDLAVAFRIPVAPIGAPDTLPTVDHFVQREVFVESELGVLQPRVPYRSDAFTTRPPGRPPLLGADNGRVHWPPRSDRPERYRPRRTSVVRHPDNRLHRVLGRAGGHSIPRCAGRRRHQARGGAPPRRYAVLRGPSSRLGPVVGVGPGLPVQQQQQARYQRRTRAPTPAGRSRWSYCRKRSGHRELLPQGDGKLRPGMGRGACGQSACVMVRMPAFGLDGPWRDRVGFAQTMEQATGMAWMTGHADGPPVIPRGVCDPMAGLHAAFAAVAALAIRDRQGTGMHVESTMVESALNVAAEMLLEYSRNGIQMRRQGNRGPGATPQGVYRCRGRRRMGRARRADRRRARILGRAHRQARTRIRRGRVAGAVRRNRQADLGLDRAATGGRRGRAPYAPRGWPPRG